MPYDRHSHSAPGGVEAHIEVDVAGVMGAGSGGLAGGLEWLNLDEQFLRVALIWLDRGGLPSVPFQPVS